MDSFLWVHIHLLRNITCRRMSTDTYIDYISAWNGITLTLVISSHNSNWINTFRPRQYGHHFADNIFKCIFLNENVWILNTISLKCVRYGPINNMSALVWLALARLVSPVQRQTIIWTTDGLVHWRSYASFGLNGSTGLMYQLGWLPTALPTAIQSSARKLCRYLVTPNSRLN